LPLAERQARFNAAINAAIKYARSDMSRLEVELRAADFEVRIMDQIDAAIGMTELAPERRHGLPRTTCASPTISKGENWCRYGRPARKGELPLQTNYLRKSIRSRIASGYFSRHWVATMRLANF
jgi:hypothetical protein